MDSKKKLENLFKQLSKDIIEDILERIAKVDELIPATDFELWKLNQYGYHKKQVRLLIEKALAKSSKTVDDLYKSVLEQDFARNKDLYNDQGIKVKGLFDNPEVVQMLDILEKQAGEELKNITGTIGYIVKEDGVSKNQLDSDYLRKALNIATLEASTGTFSKGKAIEKAVKDLTNSGLRYFDYASGHKDRVDVAVRRAVMTGVNQLTDKVAQINAEKLETNKFEVSAHLTARPSHMEWQGKVYTYEELQSICGLGKGEGLCGWNCYHHYDPFIEGVSVRKYTDEELKRMKTEAKKKTVYKGKEYTKYEATQEQRRLEREILGRVQRIDYLKKYGGDKETIQNEEVKYHGFLDQYKDFSEKMGLPFEIERTYTGRTYSTADLEKKNEYFKVADITTEFRENTSPGIGTYTILKEEDADKDERRVGNWLVERFGGDVKSLIRSEAENVESPDYEWNNKLWDLKTCDKLNSIKAGIKHGVSQIKENPGGVIIELKKDAKMSKQEAIDEVNKTLIEIREATKVILKDQYEILGIYESIKK